MLIRDSLRKTKSFTRKGIISSLSVPTGAVVLKKKYDLEINPKKPSLSIKEGAGVFVISDVVGFSETSEFVLFFLDNAVALELTKGYIYVPKEDGKVEVINDKNKISVIDDSDKISWKSVGDLIDYCKGFVQCNFEVNSKKTVMDYMYNLMFYLRTSYRVKDNCLFSISMLESFNAIGIGKFEYVKKEKVVMEVNPDRIPEKEDYYESKSDKYIEESTNAYSRGRKADKYDYYDDNNYMYEDDDDERDLPMTMHEIDIFSEYNPEEDD